MAERKVFGRLERGHEGAVYMIEMRQDGIWVRRKYGKALYQIPFSHLLNLAEKQMKLDIYEKNQAISSEAGQTTDPRSHDPVVGEPNILLVEGNDKQMQQPQ